jgi:hypothetical protein
MTSFADNRFDIGRVISRTISVITGNFVQLGLFALIMFGGPGILMQVPAVVITSLSGQIGSAAAAVLGIAAVIIVVNGLIGPAVSLISLVGSASIYFELRGSRDGVGIEALANVFK